MKPAVSLYSFSKHFGEKGSNLRSCVDMAAQYGAECVDVVSVPIEGDKARQAFARELGDHIRAVGLEAQCYCVGADFINAESVEKEADRLKKEVDLAAAYGCALMRHDATAGCPKEVQTKRGFDDLLKRLIEGYTLVTEYAKTLNIKTCVENHGLFVQDSDRVEKLINGVGHPNFGALVDIGNFSCADEDNAHAVGVLAPYAFHVHVKDFHYKSGREPFPGEGWFATRGGNHLRGAILGHGNVAVAQCIRILHRAGYNGPLTLEFEGLEDQPTAVRISLANLKTILTTL